MAILNAINNPPPKEMRHTIGIIVPGYDVKTKTWNWMAYATNLGPYVKSITLKQFEIGKATYGSPVGRLLFPPEVY
jgi:hypothetical protein